MTISDERIAEMLEFLDQVVIGRFGDPEMRSILTELQTLRAILRGGVKVKGLEWSEFHSDDDVLFMQARGLGVRYEVFHKASDVKKIGIQVARYLRPEPTADDEYPDDNEEVAILGYGRDFEAAYAIAQADYERRIMLAIEIEQGQEPIAWISICRAGEYAGEAEVEMTKPQHPVFNPDWGDWLPVFASPSVCKGKVTATHRHKKRGTEYVLIGIGKMQAEGWEERDYTATDDPAPGVSIDMREVAIYRSASDPNEIWVRPREEFEDGRFEALPAALQEGV